MKIALLCLAMFAAGGWTGWTMRGRQSSAPSTVPTPEPEPQVPSSGRYKWEDGGMTDEEFDAAIREVDEYLAQGEHPEEDEAEPVLEVVDFASEKTNRFVQEEAQEEETDGEDEDPTETVVMSNAVEPITEVQYQSSYRSYEKDEMLYFEDVDELCFENEDRVDDPAGLLGKRPYDLFETDGGNEIYLRLNRLGTDVMITKKHGKPYWYEEGQ